MNRQRRTFFQKQDGSVILETALMISVLLILMFGMVDFGRVMYTSNGLVSAAREGARFGAARPTSDAAAMQAVQDTVIARFNPYKFGGDNLVRANITATAVGTPTTSIKVAITYPFTWITPVAAVASLIANHSVTYSSTLHAQAEYRYENQ
jgi:Flp pilus assembly protein TadG